ncbi:MAG TPA: hypothetical protein DCQ57_17710 [Enterobacteriaceae bacterium]|nr:hypothetical protein [Enterobacteriaceae bacterium]
MPQNYWTKPGAGIIPAANANVTFGLTLPPNAVTNHIGKWVITLAYDQNGRRRLQWNSLEKCEYRHRNATITERKFYPGGFMSEFWRKSLNLKNQRIKKTNSKNPLELE